MRALCLLRESLAYRRDAFLAGLVAVGCHVVDRVPTRIGKDDVLIIWNRYGGTHETAQRYEDAGGKVIVTENGHLGKSWNGGIWFAMALGHHAGAGEWPYGGPHRWDAWNVPLGRWRKGGSEYIVFAQRGIGERGLKSPDGWHDTMVARLYGSVPGIKVRVRKHPGVGEMKVSLEDDLKHAAGAITWHSAAALGALMMGVPIWYDCPSWLGGDAAKPVADLIAGQRPAMDDNARLRVFRRVAWAMWEIKEIAAGEPFRHLLDVKEGVAA